MNNRSDKSMLSDCYHISGKFFPMPENTDEGPESGPQKLVNQSDRQKDAGLNASEGVNRSSTWSAEGKAFPPDGNGKESSDEQPVFAGARASVSVNLHTGQIQSDGGDIKRNRI